MSLSVYAVWGERCVSDCSECLWCYMIMILDVRVCLCLCGLAVAWVCSVFAFA